MSSARSVEPMPRGRRGRILVAGGAERRRASIAVPSLTRSTMSAIVTAWCSSQVALCPARRRRRRPDRARSPPGARPRAQRQAGVPGRPGTAANATGPRAGSGGAP